MDFQTQCRYTGSHDQLYGVRRLRIQEGRGKGTDLIEVTTVGGMLYTCGLRSVGPACRDDDEWLPAHGHYHGLQAAEICASVEGGDIVVSGVVRETALFRLVLPEERRTTPRTEHAKAGLGQECAFDVPTGGTEEQVYFHEREDQPNCGTGRTRLENPDIGISATLSWSLDTLPILAEWKSMASGDYALGLEPSNCYVMGRHAERENGTLRTIGAFEAVKTMVKLHFE